MAKSSEKQYIPALAFNWLTPCYDTVVGVTTRESIFKRALIAQANIQAGHEVLDLASGTGTLTIWAKQAEPMAKIRGLDGDPAIISIAKQKAANRCVDVQFDQGLSFELPYHAAVFDRAISSLFFHHLTFENKLRTAKELFRVIKPGGELHVGDWGSPKNKLMRGLFYAIQILDGFSNTNDNVQGRLVEVFNEAGFCDVVKRRELNTVFGTLALYGARKKN